MASPTVWLKGLFQLRCEKCEQAALKQLYQQLFQRRLGHFVNNVFTGLTRSLYAQSSVASAKTGIQESKPFGTATSAAFAFAAFPNSSEISFSFRTHTRTHT
eukprot:3162576-Amphidinium_carterae.1